MAVLLALFVISLVVTTVAGVKVSKYADTVDGSLYKRTQWFHFVMLGGMVMMVMSVFGIIANFF